MHEIINGSLIPEGIFGYPYYYIGSESWFDESAIKQNNLEPFLYGLIGTLPWFPDSLTFEQLTNLFANMSSLSTMYFQAQQISNRLISLWNEAYTEDEDEDLVYNLDFPTVYSYYAWDSIHTLIDALSIYDENYGMDTIWNGTYNQSDVIQYLNDILINGVQFIGASGNVSFDNFGDREHGFYLFANGIDNNGTLNYFGLYSSTFDLSDEIDPNNDVVWPKEFEDNNIIPQSSIIIDTNLDTLDLATVTAMYVFFFGIYFILL